jgi:hypothetical protein
MSAGPGSFVSMQQMHGHMHGHPSNMGMPMSMPPTMVDLAGKQSSNHMVAPSARAIPERKIRGQTAAATSGSTTKRATRMPRSSVTRPPSIQAQAPTAQNVYQPQAPAAPHSIYPQTNYAPWIQTQTMPGAQQPQMMAAYQNPPQMKQPHVMPNVRPTGGPGRPGVQYTNQLAAQQQQGQPPQMPVGYMNDSASMMMPSAGANSLPPNTNRSVAANSVKRKLNDTTMYTNEQPQYPTPAKMPLQTTG